MDGFEAARILYRHDSKRDARALLQKLWENRPQRVDEFRIFCALLELWAGENPAGLKSFIESFIFGDAGEMQDFWGRRSASEQAVLLDWHGQLALHGGEPATAFESFSRSASLGRDTPLLWRLLGSLCVSHGELDLGLRYIRRSLQLHRQPGLDLLSGRDFQLGSFSGEHPLRFTQETSDYLKVLLDITKLAKGQKNLKSIRELVVEMIHQFPNEERLPKIRLLVEQAVVQSSLDIGGGSSRRMSLPFRGQGASL
jgi:hypothetical protein